MVFDKGKKKKNSQRKAKGVCFLSFPFQRLWIKHNSNSKAIKKKQSKAK
jgi:hypothetical protein